MDVQRDPRQADSDAHRGDARPRAISVRGDSGGARRRGSRAHQGRRSRRSRARSGTRRSPEGERPIPHPGEADRRQPSRARRRVCEPATAASTNPMSSQFRSRASRTTAALVNAVITIDPPSHENGRASVCTQPGRLDATHSATSVSIDASGSRSYTSASATKPARLAASSHHAARRREQVRAVASGPRGYAP